jgi:serine/threonine-protein kinase
MEFIPGENLFQVIKRRGALPEAEIVTYIRQIGEALIKVHEANLVHRDAHPRNIMIRNNSKAVLIDFGIAKEIIFLSRTLTDRDANREFAPYEQIFKGSRKPQVDIYCLAASLYYGVTGQYPTNSLARRIDNEPLIPPQKIISGISNELNQAILKGMALEAKDRPESMQLWLKMLTYKSQILNAGEKSVNPEIIIVSESKNINNVEKNNINVEPNIVNVKEENPIVTPPPPVIDTYKKEVVDLNPTVDKKLSSKKPARIIPWCPLSILLLAYFIIGFMLINVNALFWLWFVAVVAAVFAATEADAWELARVVAGIVFVTMLITGASSHAGAAGIVTWIIGGVAAGSVGWARAELETSFSKFHTFLILAGTSIVGLGLVWVGWIVYLRLK